MRLGLTSRNYAHWCRASLTRIHHPSEQPGPVGRVGDQQLAGRFATAQACSVGQAHLFHVQAREGLPYL